MFENEFDERMLDFTNYDLGVSSKKKTEKKERQNIVEHTRPHVYRCARKD